MDGGGAGKLQTFSGCLAGANLVLEAESLAMTALAGKEVVHVPGT